MNRVVAGKRRYRNIVLIAGVLGIVLVHADVALAQGVTGDVFGPVQTVLEEIVRFITGPFGRLAATIAVIGLGFLAFAGRLSWFMAGAVIIGIGLVFGAESIVEKLADMVAS